MARHPALDQAIGLHQQGRLAEAEAIYRQVLDEQPNEPDALHLLGLIELGRQAPEPAERLIARATAIEPDRPVFAFNLGLARLALDRLDGAVEAFERASRLKPDWPEALGNLGVTLGRLGRYAEALAPLERAVALKPLSVESWNGLAGARRRLGRNAEALAACRRALDIAPDDPEANENFLLFMLYESSSDEAKIFAAHRDWAGRFAEPLRHCGRRFSGSRDPDRRLNLGFVSPDFSGHSCGYFIEPLLANLDRAGFAVHAFSDVAKPDGTTARLRDLVDGWHDIVGQSDAAVAERIITAEIDVLVDLTGHTRGHRLGVFARQAAPVQITWLGYPATTGLSTFAARLTDSIADPPGGADAHHSEPLVRLDPCFLVYRPPADAPEIMNRPDGPITFGSFNNLNKLSNAALAAWAEILRRRPQSRLLLKGVMLDFPEARAEIARRFTAQDIAADRLELHPWIARERQPMALYRRVDVGLDSFPYNGTTTTCEALWMGVPVIALRGDRHAGRVGASLLSAVGCPELIADNIDGYIAKAVDLADDRRRLMDYRARLRDRMMASALCDERGFAERFGTAVRRLWQKACR